VPRQSPVPEAVDREFYAAAQEERLVVQYCALCDRWQYPPVDRCPGCGAEPVWREVEGRGTVYSYAVVQDTQVALLRADLPYVAALITLDDCPGVTMLSQLHGTPPEDVRIGQPVRLVFVETPASGQKVPEWEPTG
jgi:uncharacterized protein